MKKTILIITLLITSITFAQNSNNNIQNGYIAEGYDVVDYFNNKAQKGLKKYKANFKGAAYLFSSQKNLDAFNAKPQKYSPQYGGYCAYAMATKGKKIEIDPETFEIRNGKLFLFYNSWGSNVLKAWLKKSPEALIVKADANWSKLTK